MRLNSAIAFLRDTFLNFKILTLFFPSFWDGFFALFPPLFRPFFTVFQAFQMQKGMNEEIIGVSASAMIFIYQNFSFVFGQRKDKTLAE